MKKLYFFPAVLLAMLAGFQSCSKQSANETVAAPANRLVKAIIAPNQTYQLTLDDLGSVSIFTQASHALVSQTEIDSRTSSMIYKYIPAVNFVGTDEVVLLNRKVSRTPGSGCGSSQNYSNTNDNYVTNYITLRIEVTSK